MADGQEFERRGGFDFVSDSEELTTMLSSKFISLAAPVIGDRAAQECLTQIMGDSAELSARALLAMVGPI
jgi:hypothetical protein